MDNRPLLGSKIRLLLIASFTAAVGMSAPVEAVAGFCFEPRAPSIFILKPTKPYCAASRTCSEYDVSSYKNRVRSYYNDLQTYADDVDRFYKKAGEYVQCMADLE